MQACQGHVNTSCRHVRLSLADLAKPIHSRLPYFTRASGLHHGLTSDIVCQMVHGPDL